MLSLCCDKICKHIMLLLASVLAVDSFGNPRCREIVKQIYKIPQVYLSFCFPQVNLQHCVLCCLSRDCPRLWECLYVLCKGDNCLKIRILYGQLYQCSIQLYGYQPLFSFPLNTVWGLSDHSSTKTCIRLCFQSGDIQLPQG